MRINAERFLLYRSGPGLAPALLEREKQMQTRIAASAIIRVPAQQVYTILADYHNGHSHILPSQYFSDLHVEQGGIGAGTVIGFQMRVLGKTQTFRAAITEPEPGHVLVETNLPSGPVTTIAVDPNMGGQHAQVTITTELTVSNWLEGVFTKMLLHRIYVQELELLAAYAQEQSLVGANMSTRLA